MLEIILILVLAVIIELSTLVVFGKPVPKYMEPELLKTINLDNYFWNNLSRNMICSFMYGYIAPVPFSFYCRYQINGVGVVPYWSPLHKHIKKTIKDAKLKYYSSNNNQSL